jgi:hypothetical protein
MGRSCSWFSTIPGGLDGICHPPVFSLQKIAVSSGSEKSSAQRLIDSEQAADFVVESLAIMVVLLDPDLLSFLQVL